MANKKEPSDKGTQEVIRRLDALISVLLETGGKNGNPVPMVTRIRVLRQAGLRPVEISRILGKKIGYISKELFRLRKVRAT